MRQPKTKRDRSAYERSVDRLACAIREMLGMGPVAENGNAVSGEPGTSKGKGERTVPHALLSTNSERA